MLRIVYVSVQQRRPAIFPCILKGAVVRGLEKLASPCVLVGTGSNTPERVFIDRGLENKECVRFVVGVDLLTIGAKVRRAVRTAVPLPNDLAHVFITNRETMFEVTEISCFDVDEQLPRQTSCYCTFGI